MNILTKTPGPLNNNNTLINSSDTRLLFDSFNTIYTLYTFRDNLEGEHFVRFYKFISFPCICIIDPNTGELLKQWGSMTHIEFMKVSLEQLCKHDVMSNTFYIYILLIITVTIVIKLPFYKNWI